MAVLAKLYEGSRAAERHDLATDTTLRVEDRPIDILIANLSATGCLFVCQEQVALGAEITIGIPGTGRRRAHIVRHEGERYGCVFVAPLGDGELAAAFDGNRNDVLSFSSPAAGMPADAAAALRPRTRLIVIATLAAMLWAALLAAVIGLL